MLRAQRTLSSYIDVVITKNIALFNSNLTKKVWDIRHSLVMCN